MAAAERFEVRRRVHVGDRDRGRTADAGDIGPAGLHIVDGSAVSANLGVNPALTITAQAERAMSFWPNKNELDPRPDMNAAYQRVTPVAPRSPVVPPGASGVLRLRRPDSVRRSAGQDAR